METKRGRGAPVLTGTAHERQQCQVRILKADLAFVTEKNYFGFKNLSHFILSLWDKEIERRKGDKII